MKWIITIASWALIASPLYGMHSSDARAILQQVRALQNRKVNLPTPRVVRIAPPLSPKQITPRQISSKGFKSVFLGTVLAGCSYIVGKKLHII